MIVTEGMPLNRGILSVIIRDREGCCMNVNMNTLVVIAAIATYEKRGDIAAVRYLMKGGYTRDGAVDLLARYDHYKAFIDDKTMLP